MIEIYGKTDKGPVREKNEDSFRYMELINGMYMAVVCDGMGGENGGEVASTLAVNKISDNIINGVREDMDLNSIKHMIISSVAASNSLINIRAENDLSLKGMGTTAIVCIIADNMAHIGHVGDSRAYHFSKNKFYQITKDHTMVQAFLEQGKITKEEAKNHPDKNLITRAIGPDLEVEVDYYEFPFLQNERILICTDGLSSFLTQDEIKYLVLNTNKKEAVNNLVETAIKQGSNDNITAVMVESK